MDGTLACYQSEVAAVADLPRSAAELFFNPHPGSIRGLGPTNPDLNQLLGGRDRAKGHYHQHQHAPKGLRLRHGR